MSLPRWALRFPAVVWLAVALLVAWGLVSYSRISRREDPEIKVAVALVTTIYPGADAEAVERQVTRRLEEAIEGLPGLDHVSSTSRANLSAMFVEVRYETDTDIAWQKLRSRLAEARKELPAGIVGPEIYDTFGDTTAMIIALRGAAPAQLAEVARELRAELRSVPAVGDITTFGEIPEVVYVEATAAELARSGLTPHRISQAFAMRNLRIPAGALRGERYQYRVEPSGAFHSARDVEDTVLDVSEAGQVLHVRDVFRVRRGPQSPPDTKVLWAGETAIAVGLVMRRGANVVRMGEEVLQALERFRKRLPSAVKMEVLHDSPRQVERQVGRFMRNLIEGLLIVVACMGLFMGWRAAVISATALPLSVLAALALMPLLGIDLEMVSIAAFIIALGMLVDDNIIVVDNIDVKLRQGHGADEAAWRGTHELTWPVIVGTLGNIFAFLPMLLLSREVGAYTRSLPLVLSLSLLASMLVAFAVTPLAARRLMRRPRGERPIGQGRAAAIYRRFLGGCLRRRALVVTVALAAFAGAIGLFFLAGFSFFPEAERDQLTVDVWLKEGSAIEETERVARLVDRELRRDPDVRSTLVHVGKGGPRFYITVVPEFQTSCYAQIMVNTRRPDVTRAVAERFNRWSSGAFPGARVFARPLIMGMPIQAPVALRISGPDLRVLRRLSHEVQAILRSTPGTEHVRDDVGDDVPGFSVKVDGERASRVGVTHTDVALAFLATHQGLELTRFDDGEREIRVVLRLGEKDRDLGADLLRLPVSSNITGEKVPLGSVATLAPTFAPGLIRRYDSRRAITALAWNRGRLADDIVKQAWPRVQALSVPPGYRIAISGEKEELDRAFEELLLVFGVIVALLVGLLAVQVGTLRRVAVVLIAVPLSVIGAAVALFLGGYSFSFMAFLGVVSLAGMVIKNGVLWIEFVERERASGRPFRESVIEAGIQRLRPIFLTAATTLGGLLPLALGGGVLFEPMAWVLIAGLAVATLLTLVVVPVFYALLVPGDGPR